MYHFRVNFEIKKASDRQDVSKLIWRAPHALILYLFLTFVLFFFSCKCHLTQQSLNQTSIEDQSTWGVCLRTCNPSRSNHQGQGIEPVQAPSWGVYLGKIHNEVREKLPPSRLCDTWGDVRVWVGGGDISLKR